MYPIRGASIGADADAEPRAAQIFMPRLRQGGPSPTIVIIISILVIIMMIMIIIIMIIRIIIIIIMFH